MSRVVSFDLFETLVNRRVWPHYSVVWHLAEEVKRSSAADFSTADFIEQRLAAEREAYRTLRADYTLRKIYDRFHFPALPSEVIDTLPAQEEALEVELAGPIAVNVERLRGYQEAGKRVIIVTDTYLERATIARIIDKVGITIDPEDVFISNEFGNFKVKGKFFRAIGKKHGIRFFGSRHIGNSRGADVHGALYAGILPSYFRAGNCNRLEETVTESIAMPNLSMAALVGELRNWRLDRIGGDDNVSLTSSVIGFTALAYLSWIVGVCRRQGIRRVYFLARDAYVLSEIVDLPAFSRHAPELEFRYLYGSRKTIAAIEEDPNVHRYLEQEGVFDGVTSAIVDVGWRGSFHGKLHEYTSDRGLPPVYGLFIGVEPTDSPELSGLRYSIFDQEEIPSRRLKNRFDANFIYLVEGLFQAPHPSTVGYEERAGKVAPVFKDTAFDYSQLANVLAESLRFAGRVLARPDFDLYDPSLQVALKRVLVRVALEPSSEEAKACGSLRVESDSDEGIAHYALSTPYTLTDLGRILFRQQGLNNYRRQWARGRIMASSFLLRNMVGYLDRNF